AGALTLPAPDASAPLIGWSKSTWQNPVAHGTPAYDGAVLSGSFGPVRFTMSVRAVLRSLASNWSGCSCRFACAARVSAATPVALGDDIDVPCSQPNAEPVTLKHANVS